MNFKWSSYTRIKYIDKKVKKKPAGSEDDLSCDKNDT